MAMKQSPFASAWGGIAGVQSALAVMLDRGYHARGLPLERLTSMLAQHPAQRFGIDRKGSLQVGFDADLVLVDLDAAATLGSSDLLQRHPFSPYVGETFRGVVRRTLRRGETIAMDGRVVTERRGRFVRPGETASAPLS